MNVLMKTAPRTDLSLETTAARETPRSNASFREVMGRSASKLVLEAESALGKLPGGPVLAAAVRAGAGSSGPGPQVASPQVKAYADMLPPSPSSAAGGTSTVPQGPPGPSPSASPGSLAGSSAAEGPGAQGGSAAGGVEGTLQNSQDMNLYFLQLQESLAAENRAYTACSNVLKARHDTVKNAIGNIR